MKHEEAVQASPVAFIAGVDGPGLERSSLTCSLCDFVGFPKSCLFFEFFSIVTVN